MEYLERRSRWKRSLKGGAAYEDDLTTPAHALTPGAEEEFKEVGIDVLVVGEIVLFGVLRALMVVIV